MESQLIQFASSQGIWSALSFFLIFYILKTQEKRDQAQSLRETKYQEVIHTLSERLLLIEDIKKDLEEIKKFIL